MKTNLIITVILATLMIPAVCMANPPKTGGYMSFFIGANAPNDTTVTTEDFVANTTFTDRVELDPGINVGLTGGYDLGYFRLEGELAYKHSEIDSITDQTNNSQFRNVDGDLAAFTMMFNGYFDIHNDSPVTPYFGGGIGYATIYLSDTYGTDPLTGTRDHLYREDIDSVFAYQVGGGLEIALNSVLSLDLSYRYMGTSKATFDNDWDISTDLKLNSHNAAVGLRIKF